MKDIRLVNLKTNYIKEILLAKKFNLNEFVSRYYQKIWIDNKTWLCKQDFNKNLYSLTLKNKTIRLKCPKCWEWHISLQVFECKNENNDNDIFRIWLTRCSDINCDYISDESLQPLINKLVVDLPLPKSWIQPSEMICESSVIIDDKYLENLKKKELIDIVKTSNKRSLFIVSKLIEKPITLIYAWIFLVLISFGIWFMFKWSSLFASISKKWITISQNQEQIKIQTNLSWIRYIEFENEIYLNENDLNKIKIK